jgi:hypothetical protein
VRGVSCDSARASPGQQAGIPRGGQRRFLSAKAHVTAPRHAAARELAGAVLLAPASCRRANSTRPVNLGARYRVSNSTVGPRCPRFDAPASSARGPPLSLGNSLIINFGSERSGVYSVWLPVAARKTPRVTLKCSLALAGSICLAVSLAACGPSGSSISTCGQYESANTSSRITYVKTIDSNVAINPNDTNYWVTGLMVICREDGTSGSSINQLLVNLGYLGPGQ